MKIALIGYGRMGRAVEQAARSRGHKIVAIVDPKAAGELDAKGPGVEGTGSAKIYGHLCEESVGGAEVCVEFTLKSASIQNHKSLIDLSKTFPTPNMHWSSSQHKDNSPSYLIHKPHIGHKQGKFLI